MSGQIRQSKGWRFGVLKWVVALGCLLTAPACGGAVYAIKANGASSKLAEARELGAEELAPYEYYYAQAHMEQAQSEAAEADYSDAINFAEVSEEYAKKAVRLSRDAHRGAGR